MFLLFWCFPPSLPSAPPSVRRPSFPSSFVRAKRRRRRRRWAEEGGGRRRTRPRSPRRYERARAQTDVTFTHRVTRPRLRERIRDKRSDFYFRLRLCRPRDHGHFNDICTWVVILRVRRASERASERPLPLPQCGRWLAGAGGREMVAKLPAAFALLSPLLLSLKRASLPLLVSSLYSARDRVSSSTVLIPSHNSPTSRYPQPGLPFKKSGKCDVAGSKSPSSSPGLASSPSPPSSHVPCACVRVPACVCARARLCARACGG